MRRMKNGVCRGECEGGEERRKKKEKIENGSTTLKDKTRQTAQVRERDGECDPGRLFTLSAIPLTLFAHTLSYTNMVRSDPLLTLEEKKHTHKKKDGVDWISPRKLSFHSLLFFPSLLSFPLFLLSLSHSVPLHLALSSQYEIILLIVRVAAQPVAVAGEHRRQMGGSPKTTQDSHAHGTWKPTNQPYIFQSQPFSMVITGIAPSSFDRQAGVHFYAWTNLNGPSPWCQTHKRFSRMIHVCAWYTRNHTACAAFHRFCSSLCGFGSWSVVYN